MVLMVIDHTRAFLSDARFPPLNLSLTTIPLFFTRWITHFCAPAFFFLAGASAWLAAGRASTSASRHLLLRGLLLVGLELTLIRAAFMFNVNYRYTEAGVIWALGWSMVALSVLSLLPRAYLMVVAAVMVLGHNALDRIQGANLGAAGPLWAILHERRSLVPMDGVEFAVVYPLVPWIGVMGFGYAIAPLIQETSARSRKTLLRLGVSLVAAFVILRAANVYGDPQPWTRFPTLARTVLSFINCQKYPPSLLFLLMTLGPTLIVLAALNGTKSLGDSAVLRPVIVLGRTPLFFYLGHIVILHIIAVVVAYAQQGDAGWLFVNPFDRVRMVGYGVALPWIYAISAATTLVLLPACSWYSRERSSRPVLRYF